MYSFYLDFVTLPVAQDSILVWARNPRNDQLNP